MRLTYKLFLAISHVFLLSTAVLAADWNEYVAPDYDEIVPGISPQTGRIYNLIPSHGRDSFQWISANANTAPRFLLNAPEKLPESVQIGNHVHYIHNQLKLGSCTGQSITQSMEMKLPEKDYRPLSPLFVYFNERRKEGTINKDSGASISDGIEVAARFGACSEQLWPYDNYKETFTQKPPAECYKDALQSVVLDYTHVEHTLEGIKTAIAAGNPVVGGITVFQSFESQHVDETGLVPMPQRKEKLMGGHAITFTGYDDESQYLSFVNSWGKTWGKDGFGFLPYAYFENPKLTMPSEIWSINAVGPKASD